MDCPKCGYTRKPKEAVPDTQCPSCGVYYAKVVETVGPVVRTTVLPFPEERRSWGMGKVLVTVTIVAGLAAFVSKDDVRRALHLRAD